jgi:perosamine synthetase
VLPRSELDIGWSDLIAALGYCAAPQRAQPLHATLEQAWSEAAHAVVALSVRSAFDLLLHALALPHGSEVLFSAVTIRDMPRIAEAHGLVPVPVDMDMRTLEVDPASIERAVSPRTRLLVVAHLFGSRMPLAAAAEVAQRHGLLLVEDCAQAFAGDAYRGAPESAVSLFSFGPIKTNTALGGAVAWVRDPSLAQRMRTRQAALPVQRRARFLSKVLRYAAIRLLLLPPAFTVFAALCRAAGSTHDAVISGAVRGFPGADLLPQIRHRPCTPLLLLLRRRVMGACAQRIAARAARARRLAALLPQVQRPGDAAEVHRYWVFPVLHPHPAEAVARMWRAGFDATQGASSLQVLAPPPDRPELAATRAAAVMARLLYLPVHPALAGRAAGRLARAAAGIWPAERAAPAASAVRHSVRVAVSSAGKLPA